MHKRKLIVALAMLLLIASIGTACTAKQVGEPTLAEVTVFEPVTPTPTAEPTPVTTDSSLSAGEYDDIEDSDPLSKEGYSIPIATDINEADNTPLPSTPTPVPMPTATPKPTSTPTPLPTATATPLPASTPTIPPVPTKAPASTPVPALTPMPAATPAPVLTPAPTPIPEAPKARTICNICGADITGNVPAHGDGHLLNGEDFSYRVE